ncbi:MAG TPA: hypothetical protein ENI08_02355 [Candidatus Dependentiae bacterium]|nr:hypothetical protein [Candidatus Dependentiae bacterium]
MNLGFLFLFSGALLSAMEVDSSKDEKEPVRETFLSVTLKKGLSGRYYDSRNDLIFMKKNDKNYGIVKRGLDGSDNWFFVVSYHEDTSYYCYRNGRKGFEGHIYCENGPKKSNDPFVSVAQKTAIKRYKMYSKAFQATENR